MPVVDVEEIIASDIEAVWALIADVESYSTYMEPVQSVRTLQRQENSCLVEWEVLLKGSLLKWTERETRMPERQRIEFVQTEGDLEVFRGFWQLEKIADRVTKARLCIEFEIGIPMLRDMLDPVAERALRDNSRTMLRSLDTRSATLAAAKG